jgi:hypothetical protein
VKFRISVMALAVISFTLSPCEAAESPLDSAFGFKATIPDGWKSSQSDNPSPFLAHFYSGPSGAYMSIKVTDLKPQYTEKSALEYSKKKTRLFKAQIKQINGRSWVRSQFDFKAEGEKQESREIVFTTFTNKRFYHFNFGSLLKNFNALNVQIDKVMQSVKFQRPRTLEMKRPGARAKTPELLQPKEELTPAPAPLPKRDDNAEPKPAPKLAPAVNKTPEKAQLDALSTRYGAQLVASDGEYDADLFAAKHLNDGKDDTCWRNRPGKKLPQTFIFALQKSVTITALEVVNRKEAEFPGISARKISFEGSTKSKDGPWLSIAKFEARESGKTSQTIDNKKARWLRLTVESNYGYTTLTQIAAVKVLTTEALKDYGSTINIPNPKRSSGGQFRMARARLSKTNNGPDDGSNFEAGQRVYLNFKPRGMTPNRRGRYWLVVDLEIIGANDKVVIKREKLLEKIAQLPRAPLSIFVSLSIDIPTTFPPGSYKIRWKSHDKLAKKSLSNELPLEVLPAKNAPDEDKKGG